MLKKLIYPAIFLQEDDGITITFPDLPGCISCADTFEEAYSMAKESMELFLEDYIKDLFESAPKPSRIQDIKTTGNECIALIELDINRYLRSFDNRAIKKTLTIPSWLNDIAVEKHLNFSKVLQEALIECLEINN
ncbi:MAG: HicB family protein [Coprobacillus sp.]|nr:HicB family protein [Coprobacillus sp.]